MQRPKSQNEEFDDNFQEERQLVQVVLDTEKEEDEDYKILITEIDPKFIEEKEVSMLLEDDYLK